ncbi:MAG: hypothetical protein ACTSU9_19765, partial [Promethearchaeota archaeon]
MERRTSCSIFFFFKMDFAKSCRSDKGKSPTKSTTRTRKPTKTWDALAIDTRGTRGTLATAITYMPKRRDLMDELAAWVSDLQSAGLLPRFKDVVPVSPYTGQTCDECFAATGRQGRTR